MICKGMCGAAALAGLLAVAGCGKKTDTDAPLAFVPVDTAYVVANLEPLPEATVQRFARQMQQAWPIMIEILDRDLAAAPIDDNDRAAMKVAQGILDEIRGRDTLDKWREVGFSPKARSAFYAVGLLPVARIELGDPDAFRAWIARLEQKAGSSLAKTRIGSQEAWSFGTEQVVGLMAIEDHHLVLSVLPASADDATRRRALGLDRPAKSLADSGALAELDKTHGYLPYGSGWIDTRRLLGLLIDDPNLAALGRAFGAPAPAFEPACRNDFDRIAANVPRMTFGYDAIDAARLSFKSQLELAAPLAQSLQKITGAPPGPHADPRSFADFGIALAVVKLRDFWVEQADAVAKTPFACAALAPLNEGFAEAREKLDQVIPPPLSDFSGLRITLDRFSWPQEAAKPEVAGRALLGTSNPGFLVNLAQMTAPALASLKLAPDGKPVAIPAAALPAEIGSELDLHAAMTANLLGISVGKDESAGLAAALGAPPAAAGVVLDASYSGQIYTVFGQLMSRFASAMPDAQRSQFEAQGKLYAFYATWFKRLEARIAVTPEGIDLSESIEFAEP